MPVVTVQLWEGQSVENKRQMAGGITEVIRPCIGGNADGLVVIFQDVPFDSWARGGKLSFDREDLPEYAVATRDRRADALRAT